MIASSQVSKRRGRMVFRSMAAAALMVIGLGSGSGRAESDVYPSRQIHIIVGFPPGGGVDVVARLIADKLAPLLGKPVVVENRAGASGSLATRQVAAMPPDGYTLLMNSNSMLANQVVNANAGHDVERQLVPVLKAAVQSNIIVATSSLDVSTLADVINLARTRELDYGSPGAGSIPHLSAEYLFSALAGVRLKHIPFPGAAQALTTALAGHIQLASVTTPPAVPLVQEGKLKAIAVTSARREPALPNVPTVAESGFKDFATYTWAGFFAPAATPQPVIDTLANAMLKILEMPDVKEKLVVLGFDPAGTRSADFSREISGELRQWSDVAQKVGIKF
jgi:tripartite-type tricarboxylate transporter receptor subunit TctC